MRHITDGSFRTISECSETSGSSSSNNDWPSNNDHNKLINRSVPSENWSSRCLAPLGRQCLYVASRWGVPEISSRTSLRFWNSGTTTCRACSIFLKRARRVRSFVSMIRSKKRTPKGSVSVLLICLYNTSPSSEPPLAFQSHRSLAPRVARTEHATTEPPGNRDQ